jgi:tungstate transport system ATP-binding protein
MSMRIELRNLIVHRASLPVLEIAKLFLGAGKIHALVGPNGAGKSTLLMVLTGLIAPEQGDILINDQPVEDLRNLKYRRRVGLVMQDPLLLNLSVYENIAIGLHFRHVPGREIGRQVEDWGTRLGIRQLLARKASTLSGGEAQRVALARVFVLQPELLLLDEPFGALDRKTRIGLLNELKILLPTTSATTIFSTHDEREVDVLADNRIELASGKISAINDV